MAGVVCSHFCFSLPKPAPAPGLLCGVPVAIPACLRSRASHPPALSPKDKEFFEAKKKEAKEQERVKQETEENALSAMTPEDREAYLADKQKAAAHEARKGKMLSKQLSSYGSSSRGLGKVAKARAHSTGIVDDIDSDASDGVVEPPPGLEKPPAPPGTVEGPFSPAAAAFVVFLWR